MYDFTVVTIAVVMDPSLHSWDTFIVVNGNYNKFLHSHFSTKLAPIVKRNIHDFLAFL